MRRRKNPMPKPPGEKRHGNPPSNETAENSPKIPTGIPGPEDIISEEPFISQKGTPYVIKKTLETDPYDKPLKPEDKRHSRGDS